MDEARERSGLTRAELDRLLAFVAPLDPDPGRAYARAQEGVESFFRWRGQRAPRELADLTLDRVAKKLAGGEVVTAAPMKYVLGVARLVLLEESRRGAKERGMLVALGGTGPEAPSDPDLEARLARLEACAARLSAEDRALLVEYHQSEGRARIDGRQALADRLGLTLNGLRVRAFRIRARLLECMKS